MSSFADLIKLYTGSKPIRKIELVLTTALVTGGITVATLIGTDRSLTYFSDLASHTATTSDLLGLLLFFITILLISSHIITAILEMNWVNTYYESVVPTPQSGVLLVAGIIAVLLVLLAYLSNRIIWFSFVYLVFTIFDIIGMAMLSNNIRRELARVEKTRHKIPPNHLAEVRLFYVTRPWKRLGLLRLCLISSALLLVAQHIDVLAYLVLVGVILVNEAFAWTWRIRLYRRHGFFF